MNFSGVILSVDQDAENFTVELTDSNGLKSYADIDFLDVEVDQQDRIISGNRFTYLIDAEGDRIELQPLQVWTQEDADSVAKRSRQDFSFLDEEEDDNLELGGWAVVHDSGDLIADGFDSQEEAETWLNTAIEQNLLEDTIRAYHITETED